MPEKLNAIEIAALKANQNNYAQEQHRLNEQVTKIHMELKAHVDKLWDAVGEIRTWMDEMRGSVKAATWIIGTLLSANVILELVKFLKGG